MNILYDSNMLHGKTLFSRLGKAKPCAGRTLTNADLQETDLLFIRSTCKLTPELLRNTPVKFVGSGVAGTDHIDFDGLRPLRIKVESAPGCNAESVADWFISALLAIGERQHQTWAGKTLGIVGVGHVGKIVERFAKEALGMKCLLCDPPRQEREFPPDKFITLDEMLPQCDVITFHTPLTYEGKYATAGLFSGARVRKLKPGAVLFNLARGPICDNALIATMLEMGLLSDAVIDCWEGEPDYAPELAAAAAIVSPHIAGHAYEGRADGTYQVYEAACHFLGESVGKKPAYPKAPHPKLAIDCTAKSDEAVLREVTKYCCDTEAETQRFRGAFSPNTEERRAAFDRLRKTVLHRRLFSATTLTLTNATPQLIRKLQVLGFSISKRATTLQKGL